MAYMLRSPNVRNKLIILAQGISRYNISKNRVMDIEVPTPDLSEQKEIGQYFLTSITSSPFISVCKKVLFDPILI